VGTSLARQFAASGAQPFNETLNYFEVKYTDTSKVLGRQLEFTTSEE